MNPQLAEMLHRVGRIGEGKKYYIVTFGCQMNEHDTETIAAILDMTGYTPAVTAEEADLIILNTCAVRKKPEDKAASLLGRFSALKKLNENLVIAVGGCMSQQPDLATYIKERFRHVDLIFGTHAISRLPALIKQAQKGTGTVVDINENYPDREGLPVAHSSNLHAWLPIIYGCNNFCSYCIVPYVRGRERSRKMENILAEAKHLAKRGYLEITLLGQNVNSYGQDLPEGYDFADLLSKLEKIEGLKRIRFMTSHPKDLSPKLIETVAAADKICEHFHLPVQAGSNRILEKMNRRYTRETYLELVESIKSAIPGVSITTDIMVGFPGETEEDFKETVDLVERAYFDSAFAFIYSPRKKTAAARLKDNLSYAEKERRLSYLNKIQQRISIKINESMVNSVVEVLVEGPSKNNPEMQTGRTRTNKLIHFPGSEDLTGCLMPVKIDEAQAWNLIGKTAASIK